MNYPRIYGSWKNTNVYILPITRVELVFSIVINIAVHVRVFLTVWSNTRAYYSPCNYIVLRVWKYEGVRIHDIIRQHLIYYNYEPRRAPLRAFTVSSLRRFYRIFELPPPPSHRHHRRRRSHGIFIIVVHHRPGPPNYR